MLAPRSPSRIAAMWWRLAGLRRAAAPRNFSPTTACRRRILGYERRRMTGAVARIIRALFATVVVAGADVGARADDYPTRTIRAVVPFAPAGVMDLVARIVLERVGQSLGQQIVIDNRPGAGGTIAIDLVAHAPPGGYTIVIAYTAGSLAASEAELRSGQGPQPDRAAGDIGRRAVGEQYAAGEDAVGIRCAGERPSR